MSDPPSNDVDDAAPRAEALRAELAWWRPLQHYGMEGSGFFGVAPDGSRVGIGGWELDSASRYREYVLRDGNLIASAMETFPVARDGTWSRELRRGVALEAVDLASGRTLRTVSPSSSLDAALSEDGRWAAVVSCADGAWLAARHELDSGTRLALRAEPGKNGDACADVYGIPPVAFALAPDGSRAVLGDPVSGELVLFDFALAAASRFEAHAPPERANTADDRAFSAVLSLAISPSGRKLASVGGDGMLRIWSFPDLEPLLPGLPVTWSNEYTNCYTAPRSFAPVAWSEDEQWLASPDDARNTAIRRAADGRIVARLAPIEVRVTCRPDRDPPSGGPALLEFAPGTRGLTVFSEGSLAYYALRSALE